MQWVCSGIVETSCLFPFLKIGPTFPSFSFPKKQPVTKVAFIICDNG